VPAGREFDACGVCGRTILRGERVTEYATGGGTRVVVCALCKPTAEAAGWVPAELAGGAEHAAATRRRRLGLRERLARASEAARARATRPARVPGEATRHAGVSQRAEREGQEGESRPAERGRRSKAGRSSSRPQATPRGQAERTPERILRRGVERFNASAEPRKVAGLIRTLGEPRVAVRTNSGEAIVVTVAWELSWYQWEVRAAEEGAAVREAGKGREVQELPLRDRTWNASASSDGTVRLELAAARQDPRHGE
jgi:hypothetical protein